MTDEDVLRSRPLPRLSPRARLAEAEAAAVAEHCRAHYVAGRSLRAIATDTGRSYGWVHRTLTVVAGIELRSRGSAGRRPDLTA